MFGKTAYSRALDSRIKCVFKLTNKIWFFRKVDPTTGRPIGKIYKAGTVHSHFDWK